MKLERITLASVIIHGLGWRWRWDANTPWPEVIDTNAPGIGVHGHFYIDMEDGSPVINLPYRARYAFADIPGAAAMRDVLAPVVQQILFSKESLIRPLFGGVVVTRLDIKNWDEMSGRADPHPFGLNVAYVRFSKLGLLLDGYADDAMWERNPTNRSELWETHRGPVDAARAAEFDAEMAAIWAQLKQLIITQEREKLGL